MDNLAKGVVIALLCIAKLLITGIFLCIGFRIGGEIYDKHKEKMQRASKTETAV